MAFTNKAYDPTDGISNVVSFPDSPGSSTAFRLQFQTLYDQAMAAINDLQTELEDTTLGQSGAENIGSAAIADVTGTTVRAQVVDLKAQLDALSLSASGLAPGAIDTTSYFADDVITGAKIAADQIDSEHYIAGSIDNEHLAADCVNGAKIADDSINSEHYVAGSIDNEHLSSGCVLKTNIGAGALAWTAIVTDYALSAAADSISTTSHVGYNEIMIQIKDQSGATAQLKGCKIMPLQSSGQGDPKWIDIPVNDIGTTYWRTFTINTSSISWGTTTHPDAAIQKLKVFVR